MKLRFRISVRREPYEMEQGSLSSTWSFPVYLARFDFILAWPPGPAVEVAS
ncbi:hypothetical protein HHJ02_10490 [Akkermansia muciniphila]|uniref:hypothetical protein n=1 Tax=Akkermansia muciniphila TaxID=239935 RepID=UPI000B195C20|nr:hypothetical protein [Akkermansia muciniphila]MBT8791225.1 hypothetical protein [Akkermansia muciniphila]